MKKMAVIAVSLLAWAGAWTQCSAQDSAPLPTSASPVWSSADLDQMLGPIALYPDPLIGVILPAATQPQQIVLADRYVSGGGDPNQIAQQPWDSSVQGLAHYPTVLKWMDDNLDWTTELGQAFINQQADVMNSIQSLRAKAQSLGNLQSTPQENVASDGGEIDIDPVDPDQIYVPDYQADTIYDQPGVYCTFGIGFPIGLWLGYDWDWRRHHLITWGRDHPRPQDWWHRSPGDRRKEFTAHNPNMWRPKTARSTSVIVAGGDRGYEPRGSSRSFTMSRPPVPRAASRPEVRPTEAPRVSVTVIGRGSVPSRSSGVTTIGRSAEPSRPVERSAPSESVFGGSQSSREVRQSSSRGESSRASSGSGASRSGGGRR